MSESQKKKSKMGVGKILGLLVLAGLLWGANQVLRPGQPDPNEYARNDVPVADVSDDRSSGESTRDTGRAKPRAAEGAPSAPVIDDDRLPALVRGAERIERAFENEESDVIVETAGVVTRVLSDDLEGSRHQRFIITLSTGRTVLVAHNIDLAPRVPLEQGDTIEIKGEYEWNDRGGVLHWTHHDPKGWHEDGWIRHNGRVYK